MRIKAGQLNIVFLNSVFTSVFGEPYVTEIRLHSVFIPVPMSDAEIMERYKPTPVTLSAIAHLLETNYQLQGLYKPWNVFYVIKDGVTYTVGIVGSPDHWNISAFQNKPEKWIGGTQLFSGTKII